METIGSSVKICCLLCFSITYRGLGGKDVHVASVVIVATAVSLWFAHVERKVRVAATSFAAAGATTIFIFAAVLLLPSRP